MRYFIFSLILITLGSNLFSQSENNSNLPKLLSSYNGQTSTYRINEDLSAVSSTFGFGKSKVGILMCSDSTIRDSILNSLTSPFEISAKLTKSFGYSPRNILLDVSKTCIPQNGIGSIEVWILSGKENSPLSENATNFNRVKLISMGNESPNGREMLNYKFAYKNLANRLKKNPQGFGVIIGYYIVKTSPLMKRRLTEIKVFLRNHSVPTSKFKIELKRWNDETSTFPKDKEPRYPKVFLLEIDG